MQLHSVVQLPTPRACRRRRGHKGQYRMRDSFFGKLIAATAIQIGERSQFRHNSRRPSVPASTRVLAPAARGSGCGQRCRRTALHRALTCGNVFERRAQRKASFAAPQTEWRDAGLPGAKRRDADSRVCILCSLSCTSKKVSRQPGRNPGLCRWRQSSAFLNSCQCLR